MRRPDTIARAAAAAVLAVGVFLAILVASAVGPGAEGVVSLAGPWKHQTGDDRRWPELLDAAARQARARSAPRWTSGSSPPTRARSTAASPA